METTKSAFAEPLEIDEDIAYFKAKLQASIERYCQLPPEKREELKRRCHLLEDARDIYIEVRRPKP